MWRNNLSIVRIEVGCCKIEYFVCSNAIAYELIDLSVIFEGVVIYLLIVNFVVIGYSQCVC